jgi:exopolyphosphatase/pppGpp-phosphohydrolase
VVCACIDNGSNTTRLLVAEPDGTRIRELLRQRAFTRTSDRLGRPLGVGRGGLREGVIVDTLIAAGWSAE